MSGASRVRAVMLPALAAALVGGLLAVQLAFGGGHYRPLRPADPCAERPVTSVSTGIDALVEQLVLIGLDDAACRLGASREALTLELAGPGARTDAQIDALRAGLLGAVDRLKAEGRLPRPSQLTDEAVADSHLNGFLKAAIRVIPGSLIDKSLATDDILRRTVRGLDLRTLLSHLDDSHDLTSQVDSAVEKAVRDALVARLRSLL